MHYIALLEIPKVATESHYQPMAARQLMPANKGYDTGLGLADV